MDAKTFKGSDVTERGPPVRAGAGGLRMGAMKKTPPDSSFAGLGLDARLVRALAALGYEEPTPIQSEAIPPLLAGATCSAQAATAPARRPRSRSRSCTASARPRQRGTAPSALVLVPTRELAMQVAEAIHRYGTRLGVRVAAGLRRRVDGARSSARSSAASTSSSRRRAARSTTCAARRSHSRRVEIARARRGGRDARHGLRRGPRGDPRGDARDAPDGALLGDDAAAHRARSPAKHLKDPCAIAIAARRPHGGQAARSVRQMAYVVARAHKRAALGARARHGEPRVGARLLPHAHRGGRR